MDIALHRLRNDLAVAVASVEAFIDGKLEPSAVNYQRVLDALYDLNAQASLLAPGLRAGASTGKESLLAAIVEGSPYAKILIDRRGRIALVNAQTEKLFGYTRSELLGQTIDMLVPERFRRGHPALRDAFNEAPSARPMGAGRDLYGRRKDGSEVPIEIGLNPVESETGTFTLAAISDITERKRAEEARLIHAGVQQHATELEELNRELASASRFKTQFVATMSHELRTPLTAIIGAAELLNSAALAEPERISVETISEAAEGLLVLIKTVLDFSKIEAGKVDLESRPFEVEDVVEGAVDIVAQMAHEKGTTLHAFVDPVIPGVEGDAGRLRQILLNLIANALKFTDGGRVDVRVSQLHRRDSDVSLRFEVEDSGIGIPAEMLPELFEPFSQVDRLDSRNLGGTGLGLSISKRLVELLGGEIGVTSKPGAGSLFWFTANFALAEEPAAPTASGRETPVAPQPRAAGRILVVEDNERLLQLLRLQFSDVGIPATFVSDGLQAIEAAAGARYDLIFMDCLMPNMDGLAATRAIRERERHTGAHVPIVAMTANAFAEDREACIAAGMDDYLAKPLRLADLRRMTGRWLTPTSSEA